MIIIVALIVMVTAVVIGVAGVLGNGGSGHALTHGRRPAPRHGAARPVSDVPADMPAPQHNSRMAAAHERVLEDRAQNRSA